MKGLSLTSLVGPGPFVSIFPVTILPFSVPEIKDDLWPVYMLCYLSALSFGTFSIQIIDLAYSKIWRDGLSCMSPWTTVGCNPARYDACNKIGRKKLGGGHGGY